MKFHLQTVLVALGLGFKRNGHIFLAIVLGVILGNYINAHPEKISGLIPVLDIVGQAFIRIIQMVVIPLVCSAIVVGISSIGDSKQIGKFGKKMLLLYTIISLAAVSIGAALVLLVKPGVGIQEFITQSSATEIQAQVSNYLAAQHGQLGNILLEMIPQNPIESFRKLMYLHGTLNYSIVE